MKKILIAISLALMTFLVSPTISYAGTCPVHPDRVHYFDRERDLHAGYTVNKRQHDYLISVDRINNIYIVGHDCMIYDEYQYWETYCSCGQAGNTYTKVRYDRHSISHS